MKKLITPGRITIWLLLLQEFDIAIVDKAGKDNVVADFLPRLDNNAKGTLDDHHFAISVKTLW